MNKEEEIQGTQSSQFPGHLPCPFPAPVSQFKIADIPFDGVNGWLLQGETVGEVVFASFDKELNVPEHKHGAQWEVVVAGQVELTMDGTTRTYRPGQHFAIPADKLHSALVHAGYKAIIVFEEKDRYKPQE